MSGEQTSVVDRCCVTESCGQRPVPFTTVSVKLTCDTEIMKPHSPEVEIVNDSRMFLGTDGVLKKNFTYSAITGLHGQINIM